jgi:adenylosuccinate lyase
MDENCRLMIDHVSNEIDVTRQVNTAEEFRIQLKAAIEALIRSDFPRLIHILYRLDVDEEKLKKALQDNQDTHHADVICNMIIERQLQKQEARKKFGGNENISEEEKW